MQLRTDPIEDESSRGTPIDQLSNLNLNGTESGTGTGNANGHGNGNVMPTPPSSEDERHSRPKGSNGPDRPDLRHIFAIGDCAETGAIQAGHTAYWQAEVAARNLCRLIERQEGRGKETLESYKPGLPCIKLTLGLVSDLSPTLFNFPSSRTIPNCDMEMDRYFKRFRRLRRLIRLRVIHLFGFC